MATGQASTLRAALLVERPLLDAAAEPLRLRLALAGVAVIAVDAPFTPRSLRLALSSGDADRGWLVCTDVHAVGAAATAALTGVVLIGCAPPSDDHGIVVAQATDLADAPRVMIPRDGGCWHEHH